ncbi:prepilin-type N-terminal cleavage/methylation domain-containing protein [Marinagarivorans algicola]|uniref:prepilin-type N-terminal cleavage/methylation domain-containing protein n=2 Tax=Marinagarivorans algicola TaxID=1513270 RepID=UPI0009EA4FC3
MSYPLSYRHMKSALYSKKSRGFTLIELLVTVVLVGLLLLVALPFTSEWVTRTDIEQTQSRLRQAMSIAKSRAMQNPKGIAQSLPVAVVCAGSDSQGKPELTVRQIPKGLAPNVDPCTLTNDDDKLWATHYSPKAQLRHIAGAQVLSYLFFDSRGTVIASHCPQPNRCATTNQLQVVDIKDPTNADKAMIIAAF